MIFVLIYLIVSVVIYVKLFQFIQRQSKDSKTQNTHPEMRKVRPNDPLLVVKFDGPPRTPGSEQSGDLGFHEFLTNRGTGDGNHDSP
jgi:ABC-type uncharacterized transport system substrate-binding protein